MLVLKEEVVLEQTEHILPQKVEFEEYKLYRIAEKYDASVSRYPLETTAFETKTHSYAVPEVCEAEKEKRLLDSLSEKQLIDLCVGGGYSSKGYINVPGVVGTTSVNL